MVPMFIRVKSTPNSPRRSVQIVQSLRQGSQVRQKIIRHVGIAMDNQELEQLKELAEFIKAGIQTQTQASFFSQEELARQVNEARRQAPTHPMKVDLSALRETQRAISGIHEVYGQLYRELDLHWLLPVSRYRASSEALFQCVMARIANPKSKRASVRLLEEDFGVRLPLEKVYRMMDQLDMSRVERLQKLSGAAAESLLAEPLDLLFFDCTTLYFESFVADELKQPGYSKDAKFKESQVLLALMVTPGGLPASYEVLPGSSFEGHSLLPVIERMRRRHTLRRVVIVADRGMLSEENLKALESVDAHYIVGARLRKLPKSVQAQLLDSSHYRASAQGGGRLMELYHRGRRVVVRHSPVRARKDARDRQVAVEKLIKKIGKSQNPKSLLNNYGYKKYLRIEGDSRLQVDRVKMEEEQRWDGLHGVVTNLAQMEAEEVLAHYRGLWQVEEAFRVSKHDLRVRPIFHWTPARIRAHLAIAFMALLCVRHLAYRVGLQSRRLSPEAIRTALLHVQSSVLEHLGTGQRYVIPSSVSRDAEKIYQVMGLKYSRVPFELVL